MTRWKAAIRALAVFGIAWFDPSGAVSCPEETIDYGTFERAVLSGRILPPDGSEELPGEVEFLLRERGKEQSEPSRVSVEEDGEFFLALPEGTFEFSVRVEGYFFTLVGVVVIDVAAEESGPIELHGSWC